MISDQSIKTRNGTLTDDSAATLALRALAHIVGDTDLGPRLLATTGLDVATLRAGAGDPRLLAEVLAFLTNHEPSLISVASALDVRPGDLAAAQARLAA